MTHKEIELQALKRDIIEMWKLVIQQLEKTQHSLLSFDKDYAHEVAANEKRVNSMELKIDRDCEHIFALFNPVAIDLRFVLAILKINTNLERVGDIAENISKFILEDKDPYNKSLIEATRLKPMYEASISMVNDVLLAFENEDVDLARTIFSKDEFIDTINWEANKHISEFIRKNPDCIEQALNILSIMRKLERVGDRCKNIAEEIIFYMEAKVIKHTNK